MAAQKIDGGIGCDPRKPVRSLFEILQLVFTLQSLYKGFLRQILCVGHVADLAVDNEEHTPHVLRDDAVLPLRGFRRGA